MGLRLNSGLAVSSSNRDKPEGFASSQRGRSRGVAKRPATPFHQRSHADLRAELNPSVRFGTSGTQKTLENLNLSRGFLPQCPPASLTQCWSLLGSPRCVVAPRARAWQEIPEFLCMPIAVWISQTSEEQGKSPPFKKINK